MTDLGTLGGEQSIAFAVNESDQVVGLSWTTNGPSHSFLYSNGEMTDLQGTTYISNLAKSVFKVRDATPEEIKSGKVASS